MNQASVDIIVALVPEIPGVVAGIIGLLKKYPALTPEMIVALVAQITTQGDTAFDAALAKIAVDQRAHPQV
jgi:hypothetical protein